MGRSVAPVRPSTQGVAAQEGSGETYSERLVKYFPIETSGPYVMLSGVILSLTAAGTTERKGWFLFVFVVLFMVTGALLMTRYPKSQYQARWIPIGIGVGAFVVWCYSLSALPQELGIYSPIGVIVFPALYPFLALFIPKAPAADPQSN